MQLHRQTIIIYILNITKSISGPNLTCSRQGHRLIFDMGGPMNIYIEYMGGLKLYSNQYFVRNKFTVYIDDALVFVSTVDRLAAVVAVMSNVDCRSCRCGIECRSSKLPLGPRIMSIVEAAVVVSNVDRQGSRCSSDIDRSSKAQGCRCGVKCRSSRLPLWRQMLIVEAAVLASNVDRRGCRCSVDIDWQGCRVWLELSML